MKSKDSKISKIARMLMMLLTVLATLGIDYDTLTKEEFISLIGILKKSKHMKSPISQRGKTTMTHGKGKRKKR